MAPQVVPYTAIDAQEPDNRRDASIGKAVAIGVASGVGTFFGILLLMIASLD